MKTQEYGFLIIFGFLLSEVTSQFDFWGHPDVSEFVSEELYNGHIFDNNLPSSMYSDFGEPAFGNTIRRGGTKSMSEQLGCQRSPTSCPDSKYRSHDGSCNNLVVPAIGTPGTPYSRLVPARYADGFSAPPLAQSQQQLPLARVISLTLHPDVKNEDPKFTILSMQYGQFLSHDMSLLLAGSDSTDCCAGGFLSMPPSCFPIMLPQNDPQTLATGRTCMNHIRTVTDRDLNCADPNSPAQQLTGVNHFLDLSQVYGNTDDISPSLREFNGGRLLAARRDGKAWLPQNPNATSVCPAMESLSEPCYFAGDERVNQVPQLAVLQIMLLREHNRIARSLERMNPHWDDEKLYQEARRILIAQYQVITYYEWLPIILGVQNSLDHGLIYNTQDFINDYDETVNPAVSNEHANAAYRYYHTLIAGQVDLITENRERAGGLRLSDWYNRPGIIERGNYDFLLRGLATQPEQTADEFLTNEVTQYLFRPPGSTFGDDLRTIDIQRGRDHGLAPYNEYREICGMRKARTFQDFGDVMSQQSLKKLESLYESPDDVDLIVGAGLENLVKGSLAGPTFLCILTDQFYRTRVGDRYFFENDNSRTGFTLAQLREIKKSNIARLMCDNGDRISSMQASAFERISFDNPAVSCDKLPFVNLDAWRELSLF